MTASCGIDLPCADLGTIVAAVGALGTAAYGLVDASKSVAGGMSNPGFRYVRNAVSPLTSDEPGQGGLNRAQILDVLRANWLNGVAKADQKAAAKSLVRMGLTSANANMLAAATGISAAALAAATQSIETGTPLTPDN